jgi:hypothetical protein
VHTTPRFLQGVYALEGKGLDSGTAIELQLAAPAGVTGTVVVDLGLVEV